MAIIDSSGFSHVRLTVSDIARSKAFYSQVLGWPIAVDMSDHVDEPGVREAPEKFYGGTVFSTPSGALLGLRPVAPGDSVFDPDQAGLDHVSFAVASRDDLVAAAERFSAEGIEHGEVIDLTAAGMAILSFQDPDGINLELSAPLG
ncbi:VOC family protein [Nakamurella sp. YIM 132087]|uniref:VOC family protein n=1 Tax=Nakamurella alba TaxID=2665158 RepID=A0A7K1FKX5_9ACTN|nr:VOC family protein [Nakamurella alba]MTD13883.1 VOC family protein [Nakamurella alba]